MGRMKQEEEKNKRPPEKCKILNTRNNPKSGHGHGLQKKHDNDGFDICTKEKLYTNYRSQIQ